MDLKSVLELIKEVQKTGFSKFELADGNFSIKLEREASAAPSAPAQTEQTLPMPQGPDMIVEIKDGKEVCSPVVGIFHANGTAAKAGDRFKKGDVVCMVEAMKLMNEIHMPEDGEIASMGAQDGDTVEYGQVLFTYVTNNA